MLVWQVQRLSSIIKPQVTVMCGDQYLHPSAREAEIGGPLGFTGKPVYPNW